MKNRLWVRTAGAEKVYKAMKASWYREGGITVTWNNMANKICRPYLEPA